MKTLLYILVLLFPLTGIAQQREEIVTLSGKNSKELLQKVKEWFVINDINSNVEFQMDENNSSRIIGKGVKNIVYSTQNSPAFVDVSYTLVVQCKGNLCKCLIDVNALKNEDGYEISYNDFRKMQTKEGWKEYFQQLGVRPLARTKSDVKAMNSLNEKMNDNFTNMMADLTTHIQKDNTERNW